MGLPSRTAVRELFISHPNRGVNEELFVPPQVFFGKLWHRWRFVLAESHPE